MLIVVSGSVGSVSSSLDAADLLDLTASTSQRPMVSATNRGVKRIETDRTWGWVKTLVPSEPQNSW